MSARPSAGSPESDPAPAGDLAPAAEPVSPAPMNRAERRAHARGGEKRPDLKSRDTGRHNAGPGKRQWTIRRGG